MHELLKTETEKPETKNNINTWQELLLLITGIDVTVCPFCKNGKMIHKEKFFLKGVSAHEEIKNRN